ncbi:MAG: hypothetical protein ABIF01_01070 [Candidatus Micrarchaeota archaeon]
MVLKGIAGALGFVPKEELDSLMAKISESKLEIENYKAIKETQIAKLQEEINRLEKENSENQEILRKLTGDIENVSKQYAQTQEDFRISEENSKKTQEFLAEQEKSIESKFRQVEKEKDENRKKNEDLGRKCDSLTKEIVFGKATISALQKKIIDLGKEAQAHLKSQRPPKLRTRNSRRS